MNKSFLLIAVFLLGVNPLYAFEKNVRQAFDKDEATLLRADTITADHDLGLITARGNVEIFRGERKLKADLVSYSQQTDVVTASGNVILIEPNGEEVFSNYAELSGD